MKRLAVLLFLALAATLRADVTNVVDIAALAACGTGTTNGWEVSGIDSYSDKTSVRLNAPDDFLVSPDFGVQIKSVLLTVKSSSQAGRRLTLFPILAGAFSSEAAQSCDYSPTNSRYEPQVVSFPSEPPVTRFRIALDPSGGSTGWGFTSLAVITAGEPDFGGPKNVAVGHVSASAATVSWDPDERFVSNLVSVAVITSAPESFELLADYDFEDCTNPEANDTSDKSSELHRLYPEFTGAKIFYPKQSEGVLRVSTGSVNGRLTHAGLADYGSLTMAVTARRYPGDNISKVSVYYVADEDQTNEVGSVACGDAFAVGYVPLTNVPANVSLNLGNLDGKHSNRRFLIDRIAFLKDYTPASVTTNALLTAVTTGDASCRIRGLSPRSTYLATVSAFAADGSRFPKEPSVKFDSEGRPLVISVH